MSDPSERQPPTSEGGDGSTGKAAKLASDNKKSSQKPVSKKRQPKDPITPYLTRSRSKENNDDDGNNDVNNVNIHGVVQTVVSVGRPTILSPAVGDAVNLLRNSAITSTTKLIRAASDTLFQGSPIANMKKSRGVDKRGNTQRVGMFDKSPKIQAQPAVGGTITHGSVDRLDDPQGTKLHHSPPRSNVLLVDDFPKDATDEDTVEFFVETSPDRKRSPTPTSDSKKQRSFESLVFSTESEDDGMHTVDDEDGQPPTLSSRYKPDTYMSPANDPFKMETDPETESHVKPEDWTSSLGYADDCRQYVSQCITHVMGGSEATAFLAMPCIEAFESIYAVKTWRDLHVAIGHTLNMQSQFSVLVASTYATRFRNQITEMAYGEHTQTPANLLDSEHGYIVANILITSVLPYRIGHVFWQHHVHGRKDDSALMNLRDDPMGDTILAKLHKGWWKRTIRELCLPLVIKSAANDFEPGNPEQEKCSRNGSVPASDME